jgi:hypothetical protein
MKPLKYLIYLLAAIALPIWIALMDLKDKPAESGSVSHEEKIESATVNLNINDIDPLLKSLVETGKKNDSVSKDYNEEFQKSLTDLIRVSLANAQNLPLLSSNRNINVKVDPITINPRQDKSIGTPKYQANENHSKSKSLFIYDLKPDGPFPHWSVRLNDKPNLLLYNASSEFIVVIDSLQSISGSAVDTIKSTRLNLEINSLNEGVLPRFTNNSYIVGKFLKNKKRIFSSDTTEIYRRFKIPVYID